MSTEPILIIDGANIVKYLMKQPKYIEKQ